MPFLALTTYIQLVQAFGWESWRAYLHSFAESEFGRIPDNDDQARDQFLVRYSKITKKTLAPFLTSGAFPSAPAPRPRSASWKHGCRRAVKAGELSCPRFFTSAHGLQVSRL